MIRIAWRVKVKVRSMLAWSLTLTLCSRDLNDGSVECIGGEPVCMGSISAV
jgi:hypothetical protein